VWCYNCTSGLRKEEARIKRLKILIVVGTTMSKGCVGTGVLSHKRGAVHRPWSAGRRQQIVGVMFKPLLSEEASKKPLYTPLYVRIVTVYR